VTKIAAAIGAATLLVVVLTPEGAAAQCAMCRRALASPEGLQLIAALRRGIVVLLAAPFMLFGVVAFLAVRTQQRRRRRGQGLARVQSSMNSTPSPRFVASPMQRSPAGSTICREPDAGASEG
jgi:hypothetical protein